MRVIDIILQAAQQIVVFLREAVRIQLILFLWSLPLLVWWGMPLSYGAIAGNILFSPFIALFLIGSMIYFVALISGFSGIWCGAIVEYIARWWMWCLSYGSDSWLFAVSQPPGWILFLIPLSVVYIVYYIRPVVQRWIELVMLVLVACLWIFLLNSFRERSVSPVKQGQRSLYLVPHNKYGLLLYDRDDVLRGGSSLAKWAQFQLKPVLARNYGACSCQSLFIARPSTRRLDAGAILVASGIVGSLLVPAAAYQAVWLQKWCAQHERVKVCCLKKSEEYQLLHMIAQEKKAVHEVL